MVLCTTCTQCHTHDTRFQDCPRRKIRQHSSPDTRILKEKSCPGRRCSLTSRKALCTPCTVQHSFHTVWQTCCHRNATGTESDTFPLLLRKRSLRRMLYRRTCPPYRTDTRPTTALHILHRSRRISNKGCVAGPACSVRRGKYR